MAAFITKRTVDCLVGLIEAKAFWKAAQCLQVAAGLETYADASEIIMLASRAPSPYQYLEATCNGSTHVAKLSGALEALKASVFELNDTMAGTVDLDVIHAALREVSARFADINQRVLAAA